MNLFDIVPGNFFSVLSSKNKELYVDALMLLHHLFQHELNIKTSDYISVLIELLENRAYEIEDDEEITEEGLSLSAKARLILNRFVSTGWIDRENMDGSFTEVITPRVYAIRVMQLLSDLNKVQTNEYNSLVFSTFSGLKEAYENNHDQMYEAVLNAKSNTEKLIHELKTLYHSIRSYLRKIQGQRNINILLRDHFDDYKALVDRIYHPIKTMDSIHRYMSPIIQILSKVLENAKMMEDMNKRAMSIRRYKTEEDAGSDILKDIDYVIDIYKSLGSIIGEIDKKHSSYTKLSIDTIRYHMSADQTIRGKLVALLKAYAENTTTEDDTQIKLLNLMESKIRINRQEFFDGQSLWHKNIKSRRTSAEPISVNDDARLSEIDADNLIKSIRNDYSIQQIKQFMETLFGDNNSFSTENIKIPDNRDFIMLLLAAIRAGERNTGFKAEVGSNKLIINGYGIPEIIFSRKGDTNNHVQ